MTVDVLLGLQWGDEGKGKIVDYLAPNYDVIARFQGGPNAGHTLYYEGQKLVLHHIPSGILYDNIVNLLGNGMVIDPAGLQAEIEKVAALAIPILERMFIAQKAHLILPTHKILDGAYEAAKGKNKIGSTLRGIGPTYSDKTARNGLRIGDILMDDFQVRYEAAKTKHLRILEQYDYEFDLAPLETAFFEGIECLRKCQIVDGAYFLNERLTKGQKILAEGAQGTLLDINFGTYPYVTSSSTTTSGVCNGLGIAPQRIGEVIGISKAYCTRVGGGPFPTELHDEVGERIRQLGGEFGATTGRPRRCGWIDLPALRYAIMINGVTQLVLTKVDILSSFETIQAGIAYEIDGKASPNMPYDLDRQLPSVLYKEMEGWQSDLSSCRALTDTPQALQNYIEFLERELQVKITLLSIGPNREELIIG